MRYALKAAIILLFACAPARAVDCRYCHTTNAPTKEKPSLVRCPRDRAHGYLNTTEAPRTMIFDSPSADYGAVRFSHKAHADMEQMAGGCAACHHYNEGRPIQRCEACHAQTRALAAEGTVHPDVRGARHRLCLECHRRWAPDAGCNSCHDNSAQAAFPHARRPERIIYETQLPQGRMVTFLHNEHAERFGLKCSDCHTHQSCTTCHQHIAAENGALRKVSHGGAHAVCMSCHNVAQHCSTCHAGQSVTARFDHATRTGWPLNRFHNRLACNRCHQGGKFGKLNTDCDACHKGWKAKFTHAKTGLTLNETHAGLECESCHDKTFTAAPSCSGCHPDKSYPKDKPGRN